MLADVAARVAPETFYYVVEQGGRQIGAASSAIDTSESRLVVTDLFRGVIRAGPDSLRLEARSQARFSRALVLKDFVVQAQGDLTPFELRGIVQEGATRTVRLTAQPRGGSATTVDLPVTGPVFLPTSATLPLMLGDRPRTGREIKLDVFDPIGRTMGSATLRIERDSLFTVTDSATLDETMGQWVPAHSDTVRAWQIGGEMPIMSAWVDADGRLVAAREPGGISLRRTAFELAFENLKRNARR